MELRREMEKVVDYYHIKLTDVSVPRSELAEIEKSEDVTMQKLFGKIYNNKIIKTDNKVDKKELNHEDAKITKFL